VHSHPRAWAVERDVPRPAPATVAAFGRLPTTQIADARGAVGVLAPGLRRVAGAAEFCGAATTIWTAPGDLLFALKAPDLVGDGDVLVIDGGGREDGALLGEFVAQALVARGCAGLVVDGAVRDVDGIDATGLPTVARHVYPATRTNEGPGAANVVVTCGGVLVGPGDIVRADSSGVVVIPAGAADALLEAAEAVAAKERGWEQEIAAGATLSGLLGLDEKIAAGRGAATG
jgi:4-hydroxy-4-methyl-2-oxoglutarate aldolase